MRTGLTGMICRGFETIASLYALLMVSRTGLKHVRLGRLFVTCRNADKNAATCSASKSRLIGFRGVFLPAGKPSSGMAVPIRDLEWLMRLGTCFTLVSLT